MQLFSATVILAAVLCYVDAFAFPKGKGVGTGLRNLTHRTDDNSDSVELETVEPRRHATGFMSGTRPPVRYNGRHSRSVDSSAATGAASAEHTGTGHVEVKSEPKQHSTGSVSGARPSVRYYGRHSRSVESSAATGTSSAEHTDTGHVEVKSEPERHSTGSARSPSPVRYYGRHTRSSNNSASTGAASAEHTGTGHVEHNSEPERSATGSVSGARSTHHGHKPGDRRAL